MGERIAVGFLILLLLATIGLCFWINALLGLFVLLFTGIVIWFIYGVRKKQVDLAMAQLANETGLSFKKSFFKYGEVTGNYRGFEVEIGVYSNADAFGGMGVLLASLTGEGTMTALEIRNFTGMKIKLPEEVREKRVISDKFPVVVANKNEVYLMLPHVSADAREMKRSLDALYSAVLSIQVR